MNKQFGLYSLVAAVIMLVLAYILVIVPLPAASKGALTVTAIWLFGPAIVGAAIFWKMDQKDEWDQTKPLK